MNTKSSLIPLLAGLMSSAIFGFTFLFTAQALDEVAPMHLLGLRFAFAVLALTLLQVFGVIKVRYRKRDLRWLILLALIEPVAYFFFETIGIKLTSASESGMVIALSPIVVTVFSAIFLKEAPNILQVGSICLSVGGVVFIVLMKSAAQLGASSYFGLLMLFGTVITSGFYKILSRKLSENFRPIEITYAITWVGAIIFNTIALVQQSIQGTVSSYLAILTNGRILTSVLYLGIVASIGGYYLAIFMLSRIDAVRAGVFSNLVTVVAILAGVLIRGDAFYWYQAVGSVLIILGVFGTNYFGVKRRPQTEVNGKTVMF